MNSPLSAPMIALRNITFSYGRDAVLRDISWEIPRGITALMGPNGAGKTTLLRLLTGELESSSGAVVARGEGEGSKRRVGYLPQKFNFVGRMRVWEAAAHSAWSAGVERAAAKERALSSLTDVHLEDKRDERIGSLSGGQKQRLAIACALAPQPDLLLLDEPSVGLDPMQRVSLRALLREIGSQVPIVLSTHLVDDVAQLADNILILTNYEIAYAGTAKDLTQNCSLDEAYTRIVLKSGAGL